MKIVLWLCMFIHIYVFLSYFILIYNTICIFLQHANQALLLRGWWLMFSILWIEAVADAQRAIELDPSMSKAYFRKG